jgi:hypothetical protein
MFCTTGLRLWECQIPCPALKAVLCTGEAIPFSCLPVVVGGPELEGGRQKMGPSAGARRL